jgi:hypothetical protein
VLIGTRSARRVGGQRCHHRGGVGEVERVAADLAAVDLEDLDQRETGRAVRVNRPCSTTSPQVESSLGAAPGVGASQASAFASPYSSC